MGGPDLRVEPAILDLNVLGGPPTDSVSAKRSGVPSRTEVHGGTARRLPLVSRRQEF